MAVIALDVGQRSMKAAVCQQSCLAFNNEPQIFPTGNSKAWAVNHCFVCFCFISD